MNEYSLQGDILGIYGAIVELTIVRFFDVLKALYGATSLYNTSLK
ncbi:MAG: hypothetical protein WCL02_05565 [bacterium]